MSDCRNTPAQISRVDIFYEFGARSLAGVVAVLVTLGQFGCLLRRLGESEPAPPTSTLLLTPKVGRGGQNNIASCPRAADLNCDVKPGNWM